MKKKALEILIVVVVLLAIAVLVGCKDEAEAAGYCPLWVRCEGAGKNSPEHECEVTKSIMTRIFSDEAEMPPQTLYYLNEDGKLIEYIPKPDPREASEIEFQCSCGMQYKVMGYDLCYSGRFSIVTNIPEPEDD